MEDIKDIFLETLSANRIKQPKLFSWFMNNGTKSTNGSSYKNKITTEIVKISSGTWVLEVLIRSTI